MDVDRLSTSHHSTETNDRSRQSRQSEVDVELADARDLFQAPPCRGTVQTAIKRRAASGASRNCEPEDISILVSTAQACAKDGKWDMAIELYRRVLAHSPGDDCTQQLLLTAVKRRANPYAWLPVCMSSGDATQGHLTQGGSRDPHYFQNPFQYQSFNPQDIDAGIFGYARLLKGCIYDFVDDSRFVKVLVALLWICFYDCAIPVVLQHLFDHWIPGKEKDKIFKMLFAFAITYPAYLYAHSWVINKPLDQVFVRNRLLRHALKMPWAFWNFEASRESYQGELSSASGSTANDAMVTSLITEDCNVVMDASCTAFDLFYTLIHLTCICVLVVTGLELPLIIAIPPLTVHLFTLVAIDYVAPRFLYHTARRQLEYERCVKEVQQSIRGVHAIRLFQGEGHSTQRMLTRLIDFDTHHFAAVKLRWQIEQLPDIIAQVLRLGTIACGSLLLVYKERSMTVGSLVGLLSAMAGLGGDFTALAKHIMSLTRARPSLQRIYRFLDLAAVKDPPSKPLERSIDTFRRVQSRTELLLARMDAAPIVLISGCKFSYGMWLLTNRGERSFDIEVADCKLSSDLGRHGCLHAFLGMAGSLVVVMTIVAAVYPGDLGNHATMHACRHGNTGGSLSSFSMIPAPCDELADLAQFVAYLAIATYAGTIIFLTCGFVYFVKRLSGLGWCQIIRWQESEATIIRSSLAKHDQQRPAQNDFLGTGTVSHSRASTQLTSNRLSRRSSDTSCRTRHSRRTAYNSSEDFAILQDLSMSIPRGELAILCGEAAFGKTTIFRLLMGMNVPEMGRVHVHVGIGGVVAGIEQETFIFDTTILENIRVGHPSASRKLVRSAARAAGIHSKRDLTTACGVGGKLLSPAEAQRVGIARGFLRIMTAPDPSESLLVLDDSFSFQDPQSAAHIVSHLRDLVSSGTSVVVMTQQTQLCAAADTVFLLQDGKLKGTGTHEDLLKDHNLYFRIHSISQSFSVSSTGSVTRVQGSGLEHYWIFAGLKALERSAVAKAFEPQHFPTGHIIYELPSNEEGQLNDTHLHPLFIVTRGQVEVVVGETDQQAVAVYGIGQIFGPNLSLMTLDRYSQIRCSKPTDVITLTASSLGLLCRKFTALQQAFSTCQELRAELGTNESLRLLWPGFETLCDVELEELRASLTTEVYTTGVQLCRQGQEIDKLLLVARGEIELEHGSRQDRTLAKRGNLVGHADLFDEGRNFIGQPLLSFSGRTTTPVVVVAIPQFIFMELRESNDRFAVYIEREITRHALQVHIPSQSVAKQQMPQREQQSAMVSTDCPNLEPIDCQISNGCAPDAMPPTQDVVKAQFKQQRRRRRRSITGLQVRNGRVVVAQPAHDASSKSPRDVYTTTFCNPLAAEAPF